MSSSRSKRKDRDTTKNLGEELQTASATSAKKSRKKTKGTTAKKGGAIAESTLTYDSLFEHWDEHEFEPKDFLTNIPVDSLESAVGYSSLIRQMHAGFVGMVAHYRSSVGGSLPIEEARKKAFRACTSTEEAKERFVMLMRLPVSSLHFADLYSLYDLAPRVAEEFWENVKREGRKEFESGHLAANICFPVGYMKDVWNIARYLGVRESFIDDWNPVGGIEVALVDMLAQAFFQWQFWLEQTVRRSQTREREPHHEYAEWMARQGREARLNGYDDGYWIRPTISEAQALDQAVQMADRWNRIYMRTLRQLRDLRRYVPVTINNANQVNIAADGGNQVNLGGSVA
ncbi:MAG: hypothetical protein AB7Q37_03390 [Pyrinomonadaceae bacterium]